MRNNLKDFTLHFASVRSKILAHCSTSTRSRMLESQKNPQNMFATLDGAIKNDIRSKKVQRSCVSIMAHQKWCKEKTGETSANY